MIEINKASAIS